MNDVELTGVDESLDGGQRPEAHYDPWQLDIERRGTLLKIMISLYNMCARDPISLSSNVLANQSLNGGYSS